MKILTPIQQIKQKNTNQRDGSFGLPLGKGSVDKKTGSVDKYWGHRNKNIKNSLLAMPVLRTCR